MEDLKIYVVTNIDRFKKLCEEKLGDNITADNFIEIENMKNEKVHLVLKNMPYRYMAGPNISRYDIYVSSNEGWERNNIINIIEHDIDELLEDESIEDIKTYRNWKDASCFKVNDKANFINKLFPLLTDLEAISLVKWLSRSYKINANYTFYIMYEKNNSHIYIHDSFNNIASKLPYTTLDTETLTDLIKDKVVSNCECKVNEPNRSIRFDGKVSDMGLENGFLRTLRILKRENDFVIRDSFRPYLTGPRMEIMVRGKTVDDAIHSLRLKFTEKFFEKSPYRQVHFPKDLATTLEAYKNVIKPKDEIDFLK